jgi:phage terminase small subunit
MTAFGGNPSHRPLRRVPVALGTPAKPSWLKGDAGALWKTLVPELQHAGLVGKVDDVALVSLCQTWAQLLAVDRELADPRRGCTNNGRRCSCDCDQRDRNQSQHGAKGLQAREPLMRDQSRAQHSEGGIEGRQDGGDREQPAM